MSPPQARTDAELAVQRPIRFVNRPRRMSPRSVVAVGTTGIVLALTVLVLSWHSSDAPPSGPLDVRATPATPAVQVMLPGGPADNVPTSLATPLGTGLGSSQWSGHQPQANGSWLLGF